MGACGLGVRRDVKDIDGGCGTSGGEADAASGGDSESGATRGSKGS